MPDEAHCATLSFFEVIAHGSVVGMDYMCPDFLPLSSGKWTMRARWGLG